MTAAPGTSQEQLLASVTKALPKDTQAATGDATAARAASRIDEALSFVTTFLLVFAGIALTVGCLPHRQHLLDPRGPAQPRAGPAAGHRREPAAGGAVGAPRGGPCGLVGSAVGVGLGVLLAIGIKAVFGRFGLDLSKNALVLEPRTVVVSLSSGVLVTLAAAYLPARRAGSVPPVAAMRDDVALAESGLKLAPHGGRGAARRRHRGHGRRPARRGRRSPPTCSGPAPSACSSAPPCSARCSADRCSAGLGWLYRRGFGAVGLMAEQNTLRNPRRTAATASALMIGVSLVTMMAVLGASAKASLDKTLAEDIIADYVVSNPLGQPFSSTVARTTSSRCPGSRTSLRCAPRCSRSTATATSPPPSTPRPSRPSPTRGHRPARSPTSTRRRRPRRRPSRRTRACGRVDHHHRLRR